MAAAIPAKFGAKGDGATDDTAALQAFLDHCASAGVLGVVPAGTYLHTGLTCNGSVRLLGLGVGPNYVNGMNGEPTTLAAPIFKHTAASGDAVLFTPPGAAAKAHVQLDGLTFIGNRDVAGATGGGGVHFYADSSTSSLIIDVARCNFIGAQGDNLVLEGNVFESRLAAVQCNQSATGRGLVTLDSTGGGGGLPGEIELTRVTCDSNALQGADLGGGGTFAYSQLTCTANGAEGLRANGVHLHGVALNVEVNGGAQNVLLQNLSAPVLIGTTIGYNGLTGHNGIVLQSVLYGRLLGLVANSTGAILDWVADGGCQGIEIDSYTSTDYTDRYSDGGRWTIVRRGSRMLTPRQAGLVKLTISADTTVTPDATKIEKLFAIVNTAGVNLTVGNPTLTAVPSDQHGQMLTVDIKNTSTGALGSLTFGTSFNTASALPAPAAGKRRTICFEFDGDTGYWVEMWRTAQDM